MSGNAHGRVRFEAYLGVTVQGRARRADGRPSYTLHVNGLPENSLGGEIDELPVYISCTVWDVPRRESLGALYIYGWLQFLTDVMARGVCVCACLRFRWLSRGRRAGSCPILKYAKHTCCARRCCVSISPTVELRGGEWRSVRRGERRSRCRVLWRKSGRLSPTQTNVVQHGANASSVTKRAVWGGEGVWAYSVRGLIA